MSDVKVVDDVFQKYYDEATILETVSNQEIGDMIDFLMDDEIESIF